MPICVLDRAVLEVRGPDARSFLQGLVTCDVEALAPGQASFGALLTPQGKILFDFLILCADGETFLLDVARDLAPSLCKRLTLYKLRAKVAIAQTVKGVAAAWGESEPPHGLAFADPRAPGLGWRAIVDEPGPAGDARAYHAHRIALGVPEGGVDFAYGDAYPHDVNMDLIGGVSFTKGCYVGQEVVSRMKHRGGVRRRIARARFPQGTPASGAEIAAGDLRIGVVGSSVDGAGLASVRTDRLLDARAAGLAPRAGDAPVELFPPEPAAP